MLLEVTYFPDEACNETRHTIIDRYHRRGCWERLDHMVDELLGRLRDSRTRVAELGVRL